MATYRQIRNDLKDIEALADGYKTKIDHPLWLVDGLQKDAIQNSWDARINKKRGDNWEINFSIEALINGNVLCIHDKGTTGLNGTKFTSEEQLFEILNKNAKGEDLAYFLNSNYSAKTTDEGGRRGRGKTLFLKASNDNKIFFDSLRLSDNTYIFGSLYIEDKQAKFDIHYDDDAKRQFELFGDKKLPFLNQTGTRIFIVNPDQLIIDFVLSGEILKFIQNSRWEIIKKHQAKISVNTSNGIEYAKCPSWYEDNLEAVETKSYQYEAIKENKRYRIKKLVLRLATEVPQDLKGIAVQRSGMTIERLQTADLFFAEGIDGVYGWIEMDRYPLEEEIINCEGPEHVDFSWKLKPANYLRNYIKQKLREFAKEFKLTNEQRIQNKEQREAEQGAVKLLAPFFKQLGLTGKHTGAKQREKSLRKPDEPYRLSIQDIEFPRDSRRVNFGEKITNAYVIPVNDGQKSIKIIIRYYIVSKKNGSVFSQEKEINLDKGSRLKVGLESIFISPEKFKPDEYSIKAKMLSFEDTDLLLSDGTKIEKGTILYERINVKFFVEIDPEESSKSPLQIFPEKSSNKNFLFRWEPEDNGYAVFYNQTHPLIKPLCEDTNKEPLKKYLTEQGALIALQIKLEKDISEKDSDDLEFKKIIKNGNLEEVYRLFLSKFSEFTWGLNS